MKITKAQKYILLIIFLAWVGLLLHNIKFVPKFFETNAGNMLQILVVVAISYYLVQDKNKLNKMDDLCYQLAIKMHDAFISLDGEVLRYINSVEKASPENKQEWIDIWQRVMSNLRKLKNYINMIRKMPLKNENSEKLNKISKRLKEYTALFDEIGPNGEIKSDLRNSLKRVADLMENDIDLFQISIYVPDKQDNG